MIAAITLPAPIAERMSRLEPLAFKALAGAGYTFGADLGVTIIEDSIVGHVAAVAPLRTMARNLRHAGHHLPAKRVRRHDPRVGAAMVVLLRDGDAVFSIALPSIAGAA